MYRMMIKMIIRKENAPLGGAWEAEVCGNSPFGGLENSCPRGLSSVGGTNNKGVRG